MASERQIAGATNGVSWEDVYDVNISWNKSTELRGASWYMQGCVLLNITVQRVSSIEQSDGCVVSKNGLSLALMSNGIGAEYALKKPGDSDYHLIVGMLGLNYNPVLTSLGDLIIARDSSTNRLNKIEDLANQVVSRSREIKEGVTSTFYELNLDNGKWIFDTKGYTVRVKHIAVSNNGKYAATELYNGGIGVVNLETLKIRYIPSDMIEGDSYEEYKYMKMAISNDGKQVAVVSGNYDIAKVYSIDDNCSHLTYGDMQNDSLGCYYVDLRDKLLTKSSYLLGTSLYDLSFHIADSTLYMSSYFKSKDKGVVTTILWPDSKAVHLEYLALGDSFSSGEGDIEKNRLGQKYYRFGTDINGASGVPTEKCHISTRSYPYLLARGMNLAIDSPRQWNTATCSGAKTEDISPVESWWMKQGANYAGQGDRLVGFDVGSMKKKGLNEFIPGREQQIEFVKKYQPKVITLTMGGNDVGFGEKIKDCVRLHTCKSAQYSGGVVVG